MTTTGYNPRKWMVTVTRDLTESAQLVVEADSQEEANSRALEHDVLSGAYYEIDDGSSGDPYLPAEADTDEIAELSELSVFRTCAVRHLGGGVAMIINMDGRAIEELERSPYVGLFDCKSTVDQEWDFIGFIHVSRAVGNVAYVDRVSETLGEEKLLGIVLGGDESTVKHDGHKALRLPDGVCMVKCLFDGTQVAHPVGWSLGRTIMAGAGAHAYLHVSAAGQGDYSVPFGYTVLSAHGDGTTITFDQVMPEELAKKWVTFYPANMNPATILGVSTEPLKPNRSKDECQDSS